MVVLILGLVLLLGIHSTRIVADAWRREAIARWGTGAWRGLYSAASIAGLILVVWGYRVARADPVLLWDAPVWGRHMALALNLVAFVLLAVYLVPAGRLKAWLGHPMLIGVMVWAVAHLLANGTLADAVLFGAFLAWAVADYIASVGRDRAAGAVRVAGPPLNDAAAAIVGALLWGLFVWRLHAWLIGVDPLA
jgi:uncharacterized membrane protein